MDYDKIKKNAVLNTYAIPKELTETRIEVQKQKFTGDGQTKVEVNFCYSVFAIEVKGSTSEFSLSLNNGCLTTDTKSTNGVLSFEDIAQIADNAPLTRYLIGETKTITNKKYMEEHKHDLVFAFCFPYNILPRHADRRTCARKYVLPDQNAYVDFNFFIETCLIFDKPVHGEIEILAHTYRSYYKGTNVPVLC